MFLSRGRTLANHGLAPSNFYCRAEYLLGRGRGGAVKLKSRSPALPIIRVVRREAIVLDTERLTPDERRHRTTPPVPTCPAPTPHTLAAVFNHPGVPNHYLTFITSYERRNLSGRADFRAIPHVLRDTPHTFLPSNLARILRIFLFAGYA